MNTQFDEFHNPIPEHLIEKKRVREVLTKILLKSTDVNTIHRLRRFMELEDMFREDYDD